MSGIDRQRWARLSPLLDELLELPAAERPARLQALHAQDAGLADELRALLQREGDLDAQGFMSGPALPPPPGLAGQTLGAYTLERELGRGGMGQVWLARRTDGRYEGQVAIKLLQTGLLGHGDVARFEREGRILARLDQPHIARLLDAGVADDGRQPFLVLEYVDGLPIDRYVQQHGLPLAECLRLVIDAADAVAHAHARLILHRDLKPSNMLVRSDGQLKLLDFGIAKLLDEQAGAGAGDLTQQAGALFTPDYAAPEQLQGGDVTTATDVYALGVLLYQLLGGGHPTRGTATTPLQSLRAAVEVPAPRLSDQVLRRGGPAAARRARELRGDIDTIVDKALRKQPAERYANAAELAEDLRRTLAHEPIAARPAGWWYLGSRFLRRHRVGVAAGAVALAAVLGGASVAVLEAREARAQREQAEGLLEFMLGDLRKRLQPVGRLDALDAVGERALAYYAAQDATRLDADDLARRARALHLIGEIADRRGQTAEARQRFGEAARSTAELLARAPGDSQRIFDHAQSEFWVAQAEWRSGRFDAARQGFERYRALALQLRQLDPQRADWQLEEAYAEQNLGVLDYEQQRPRQALAHWLRARQLFEPPATGAGATAAARAELSTNLGWLARAHEDLGEPALAVDTLGAKIALLQPSAQAAADRPGQYQRALAHNDRSRLLLLIGQLPAALAEARLALRELQPLVAMDASNAEWRAALAFAQVARAEAHAALGQRDEAAFAWQAADAAAQLSGPLPATAGPRDIALRARWLSAGATLSGAARVPLAPMTELLDRAVATDPEGRALGGTRRRLLAHMALQLGDALAAQGRPEAARQRWQQAARVLGAPAEEPLTQALRAHLLLRQGQTQEALTLADSLSSGPLRHPLYLDLLARLGRPLPAEGSR